MRSVTGRAVEQRATAVRSSRGSPRPLSAGVDMTSTVKHYLALRIADPIRAVHCWCGCFTKVARAIGRGGACNSDGRSCWYPWVGYHRTGVRRGACFAL